jgi:hypothetical protein
METNVERLPEALFEATLEDIRGTQVDPLENLTASPTIDP